MNMPADFDKRADDIHRQIGPFDSRYDSSEGNSDRALIAAALRQAWLDGWAAGKATPDDEQPEDCGGAIHEGDTACEHERVFSGGNNPTATPLWFFVCAKCGRVGKAQYKWGSTKRPSFDRPRFAQLMLDHHGDRSFLDDLAKRNAQPAAPSTDKG